MQKSSIFPALFLVVLSACGASPQSQNPEGASSTEAYGKNSIKKTTPKIVLVDAKVLTCHDGDTCTVRLVGSTSNMTLRLAGIDAPEVSGGSQNKGQPFGKDSRDFTNKMVKGQMVKVRSIEKDPYGRTVAEIYQKDGTLVNIQIVRKGLAEAYKWATNEVDKAAYAQSERQARSAKIGVWSQENYKSPAVFRRENKAAE